MKVLVVENEDDIREWYREVIEDEGHKVIEAKNGKEGLEKMTDDIDLVITDIEMPIMNGLELIRNLKNENYRKGILVVSSYSYENVDSNTSYLRKPFSSEDLLRVLKSYDGGKENE